MDTINVVMPKELEVVLDIREAQSFTDYSPENYVNYVLNRITDWSIDVINKFGWISMAEFIQDIGFEMDIKYAHYGWVKGGEDIFWSIDKDCKKIRIVGYFLEV